MRLQGTVKSTGVIAGATKGNNGTSPPTHRWAEETKCRAGRSTVRGWRRSEPWGRAERKSEDGCEYTKTVKVGPYSSYPDYGSLQYESPKRDE